MIPSDNTSSKHLQKVTQQLPISSPHSFQSTTVTAASSFLMLIHFDKAILLIFTDKRRITSFVFMEVIKAVTFFKFLFTNCIRKRVTTLSAFNMCI